MRVEKVVTKIVDGDTINVEPFEDGEESVRLLGIDTAETNYQGRSQGAHAEAARDYLKSLLSVGDTVTILTDAEERDKYGRVLAYVFINDENVNATLVAEGMAAPYQIYPNLKFLKEISRATVDAQNGNKGIFNPNDPLTEMPFEFRMRVDNRPPHKYVGNFQTRIYYDPEEYNEIALDRRVYFFKERDAVAAGYTARRRAIGLSKVVDKSYENLAFEALLEAPVSVLKGVSEHDGELLDQAFGIKTIDDLAGNKYFRWARAIKDLTEG
jgi:endonuclease YncB( thermonuclease family)